MALLVALGTAVRFGKVFKLALLDGASMPVVPPTSVAGGVTISNWLSSSLSAPPLVSCGELTRLTREMFPVRLSKLSEGALPVFLSLPRSLLLDLLLLLRRKIGILLGHGSTIGGRA